MMCRVVYLPESYRLWTLLSFGQVLDEFGWTMIEAYVTHIDNGVFKPPTTRKGRILQPPRRVSILEYYLCQARL